MLGSVIQKIFVNLLILSDLGYIRLVYEWQIIIVLMMKQTQTSLHELFFFQKIAETFIHLYTRHYI